MVAIGAKRADMRQLSRAEVESACHEIGEILARSGKIAEIAVYRGAAIMLQFAVTFRTADVDPAVEAGDHGALMDAAKTVAERRGWLRSLLSKALSVYLGTAGATGLYASDSSETRVGLRVYIARPDYLLAMKLRAMRLGRRDGEDAVLLAKSCDITTFEAMVASVSRYFPGQPLDARRLAVVRNLAESLHASPSPLAG
jgi:hypothetical protein